MLYVIYILVVILDQIIVVQMSRGIVCVLFGAHLFHNKYELISDVQRKLDMVAAGMADSK